MKHRHSNRILSRSADEREHLLRNLTSSLLTHGSIVTSQAKAKELRRWLEPLITRAKTSPLPLHTRRRLLRQLGAASDLSRLVATAAAQSARPGGYLRLTRLPARLADAAVRCRIELMKT